MVISVPWQLSSSQRASERAIRRQMGNAPGSVRRGLDDRAGKAQPAPESTTAAD
jgi:hypothetical protein